MNKLDFLVRFMPIYMNFIFSLVTLISLKKDFITITILLFLNETVHSQFKNEMIPALYIWVVPQKKKSMNPELNDFFIPSFHCQYIWYINCVINHYIKFYKIGDHLLNQVILSTIGSYVIYNRIKTANNTMIQTLLGMFLGIFYGFITTNYILHLEPI